MKGDFSRSTFNRAKHYSGVLMQQGRVQLDADWNELQRIHHYHAETTAKDVIGADGAPLFDDGFRITVQEGKRLSIGRGRYYVEGLLCENESDVLYSAQPDFLKAPDIEALLRGAQTTVGIVYLDVWRRHITAIDDPSIRETALGGPDTTTRLKTVWQVKVLPVRPPQNGTVSGDDPLPEWDALVKPSTGALSARSQPAQNAPTPCLIPPMAGYRRLENQLYRVEIHKAGAMGAASAPTFKWSRDNGSLVTTIERINGREITVHDLGRDLGFSGGQWVEIIDEAQELAGQPGQLIQIDAVGSDPRVITLKTAVSQPVDLARRAKLRRWDSAGELQVAAPAATNGWIALEDGVEVKFEAGAYATGDYWTIPARTATGNVEWPFTAPQQSFGVVHRYSRLGIVNLTGTTLSVQDCRRLFAPLTAGVPALRVTGINWINDDVLPQGFDQLVNNGLHIFFDGAPVPLPPASSSAAVVVTIEAPVAPPDPNSPTIRPVSPIVLRGDIAYPAPNTLRWKPAQGGAELAQLLAALSTAQISRALLRVNLKGAAIWTEQGGFRAYLDGQSLGQPGFRTDGVTQRIDLFFPSGGRAQASDFESWFYLQIQVAEATLRAMILEAPTVTAGGRVNGQIELDQPAPPNTVITLASSAPTIATVPQTIPLQAGQIRAGFTVTTTTTLQSTTDAIISATLRTVTKQARLQVQVVSVTIAPSLAPLVNGARQSFTASVFGTANTAVTWSVQEANGGFVDANGSYTAPEQVGTFHVVATSQADPNKKASATVTVTRRPPPPPPPPGGGGGSGGGGFSTRPMDAPFIRDRLRGQPHPEERSDTPDSGPPVDRPDVDSPNRPDPERPQRPPRRGRGKRGRR